MMSKHILVQADSPRAADREAEAAAPARALVHIPGVPLGPGVKRTGPDTAAAAGAPLPIKAELIRPEGRSEERRVGKECRL